MEIIYRIQNSNGKGPYRRELMDSMDWPLVQELDSHSRPNSLRPPPKYDTIGRWPNKNEICGFISLQQANIWFPRNLRIKLLKYGFRLSRIRVKEITAISEFQVLAIK